MANDTSVAPTVATYTPPPDFQSRRDTINSAYQSAADKLAAQKSAINLRYGYNAQGTGLDTQNGYGLVQQNNRATGQSLIQDQKTEQARGLGAGDEGLGAQRAGLIHYQSGLRALNTANARTSEVATNDQAQTDAVAQQQGNLYGVDQDVANWNAGQTALSDAQAAWLQANTPGMPPAPGISTPKLGGYTPKAISKNPRSAQTARNAL